MLLTESEDLFTVRQMRNIITVYGWTQGTNGNAVMGFCLNGALKEALGISPTANVIPQPSYNRYCRMSQILHQHQPGWVKWNDEPGRQKIEVLHLLDRILGGAATSDAR